MTEADFQAVNLDGIPAGARSVVGQLLQDLADTLKPGGAMHHAALALGSLKFAGAVGPSLANAALGPLIRRYAADQGANLTPTLVQTIVSKVLDAVKRGR